MMGVHINRWLLPVSWLYGMAVHFRNWMFKHQLLKTVSPKIPIISIGNITVGGTGKTPHTEYLIRLLQKQWRVAVVSRGYKRKTKGLVIGTPQSTVSEIGDEPWQMLNKFSNISVAVSKKRIIAIDALLHRKKDERPEVFLLDDAYQYRYIKPGISILLIDFNRLISDDTLLPAGRMREPFKERRRANIIIVTKCPQRMKPIQYRIVKNKLDLFPFQSLYFTMMKYSSLQSVMQEETKTILLESLKTYSSVLLISGIANSARFENDVKQWNKNVISLHFGDHHSFTSSDEALINQTFQKINQKDCVIITTEKDAARLRFCSKLSEEVKQALYILPIEVEFLCNKDTIFNEKIIQYVRYNYRNSTMDKE